MNKTRPTEDQKKQLAALDAIRDTDIDLSDIPDQGNKTGWISAQEKLRELMYRPVMRAISIRLPMPDIALAQELAGRKGLPYQTYIKQLLHDALDRERAAQ
jgi:predicted DNA binding CopG/RHH family protein